MLSWMRRRRPSPPMPVLTAASPPVRHVSDPSFFLELLPSFTVRGDKLLDHGGTTAVHVAADGWSLHIDGVPEDIMELGQRIAHAGFLALPFSPDREFNPGGIVKAEHPQSAVGDPVVGA